ncbi:VWA domain-containing protein [Brevibacterium jeotgali]|uniref:Ca-activated chloride channel family protein n=1 Tax=Brevibacterium jeotgali TaxID=1262550 RepID=A0A2H1L5P0_9MICO|nr:VWA domain-containing protein [Brevibacterium jeotgali]TWB98979.1 Ca-activated chloride channel family protein [Brevibacterium jeotgali]SMY12189.1 Ca-activated chloride channel family protein [Brevibacterium jeotgali]
MNDLVFDPLLPWPVLVAIAVILITGCVVLAVLTAGRRVQWVLRAVAVIVLAVAFSRPGVPVTAVTERSEAALDVFVVVDVTASMVAEDWDGDAPRLDGVEEDVAELVEQAPEARYSLITFAATSQTVLPLTTDDSAMRSALDVLRPEVTLYSSGSSITSARDHLVERLEKAAEDRPDSARIVFYLGDGEQTSGDEPAPLDGVADLIDGGAVWGYGTSDGGRMQETRGYWNDEETEYITDPSTDGPAVSTIDEGNLEDIAADMGVAYEHRTAGASVSYEFPDVDTIVQEKEETTRAVSEFTWMLFIPLVAWLAVEGVFVARRVRGLGLLSGTKRST